LRGVGVTGSVVALFFKSDGGDTGQAGSLHSSVSTSAIGELRQIVDELFDEGIGLSVSVEEDGDDDLEVGVEGVGVDELKFEIEFLSIDQMFRGRVEDELLQVVGDTLEGEGVAILQTDFTSEVISSIHDVNSRNFLVTKVVSLCVCIAESWSRWWNVHWRLSTSGRARGPISTQTSPVGFLGIVPSARATCRGFGAW